MLKGQFVTQGIFANFSSISVESHCKPWSCTPTTTMVRSTLDTFPGECDARCSFESATDIGRRERERARAGKFALRCWQRERERERECGLVPFPFDRVGWPRRRGKPEPRFGKHVANSAETRYSICGAAASKLRRRQFGRIERRGSWNRRFVCDASHWHSSSHRLESGWISNGTERSAQLRVFAPFIEQFPFYSGMTPSYSRHGRRCPSVHSVL